MKLTIITPTYNREDKLKRLYESLKKQTNKEFCWLIVDDGSTDNTNELVSKYIEENKVEITYVYQKNGGKHRALNNGIKMINTDLVFIVDSDDYLVEDAVSTIYKYSEEYKDSEDISGFCFCRCDKKGNVSNKLFDNTRRMNYIQDKINKNLWGDNAEVFYTNILKKYAFPEYEGEKFVSEDIVWIEMALKYDMIYVNEAIYVCEYFDGGLTKSGRKIKIESPIGMTERAKKLMYRQCSTKANIKGIILYIIYSKFANKKKILKELNCKRNKLLAILLYPISCIIYLKWKYEYRKSGGII